MKLGFAEPWEMLQKSRQLPPFPEDDVSSAHDERFIRLGRQVESMNRAFEIPRFPL